ncbi:MAG: cysteine desulfurase [Bacteroidetes bacterium]|nr:MAG: cysteine desulfurase [Bacteroidota bacterium]
MSYNYHIRQKFPFIIKHQNAVYFDNAATTQKPVDVLQSIQDYYENTNANIHRGVHHWSLKATEAYEDARKSVAQFINAASPSEIIFTSGTTHSINLLADCLFHTYFKKDDEIILSVLEHHSNILPWQNRSSIFGTNLKFAQLNAHYQIDTEHLLSLINEKTKLIAISHVSNTLGSINDIQKIIQTAHQHNIPVMIDAAQSIAHLPIDIQQLNPDFLVFSGHKIYAPTGIGILYAKQKYHHRLYPFSSGGGAIIDVNLHNTEFADVPLRLEAGTPNIEGAIGLKHAIDFIYKEGGIHQFYLWEEELKKYLYEKLFELSNDLDIYTTLNTPSVSVISFNVKNQHPFDVGTLLNNYGIAVRTGHHCTQPLMKHLKIPGTVRASLAIYNTLEEIDKFIEALKKTIKLLK